VSGSGDDGLGPVHGPRRPMAHNQRVAESIPRVQPSGEVFFPLTSNAHALVGGGPVNSVKARIKLSSLLYDRVLVESGKMSIRAGPNGSLTSPMLEPDGRSAWQTPRERKLAQDSPFGLSMARESQPGVPAAGPYHQVLASQTSISWLPTFEPLRQELPGDCDWIVFGGPSPLTSEFQHLADTWKRFDDRNEALTQLVPERFVRSTLLDHVSKDLALGAAGGWDVSVDRFHGGVIGARFASAATVKPQGFALPILIPKVGQLPWDAIVRIRRMKEVERFRNVLREIETEAFEVAATGGDLEAAVRRAYETKMRTSLEQLEGIGSSVTYGFAHLLVGSAAGYLTMALPVLVAPPVGAAIGAGAMVTWHVTKLVRGRRQRAWLGVKDAIVTATH
jgi:hypothetical protein